MKCVKTIAVELNYNIDKNISRVDKIRSYSLYSLRLLTAYIHVLGTMMCGIPLITNVSAKLVKEFELGIKVDYER